MCLILFSFEPKLNNQLVVLANRDEFYLRETAQAGFWEGDRQLLAGKDLVAGATWMGMHTSGRFAGVTNYREPGQVVDGAESRGGLPVGFLEGNSTALDYLKRVEDKADRFNGFNLLVFDGKSLGYYSNRSASGPVLLGGGTYGLSNHLLDSPWPKVLKGKDALDARLKASPRPDVTFLDVMMDNSIAADKDLPKTGVTLEKERLLSPICIQSPGYGTRCSTVVHMDQSGPFLFAEKTVVPKGLSPDTVIYTF
ncbi:MAG: NRDE family protein [Bacteroidetes Order II. Incertae sedis bacterium]|jgi:uncharacterized protein with NRDE domain|nr:NRDE family protein [Bacteroidetes Order II. bacterium]MBT4053330.1 NRDE family protein [Bacteroidetes Order II. bacterium]MBT4603849.1 NRDE family protein [Bacteroidetes Order II. bacterium]MBT5250310.1 NRDE family protein [Bacteroidetes Order II. bacterium]MBT6201929.1 NRDE family protein [Bacteroidetes Order II. bacterium]